MEGQSNPLLINPENEKDFSEELHFPINQDCWPNCASNLTKVILVRHPLERLLSAYLYIFSNDAGKYYNRKYTWQEFVNNIINYPADRQWREIQVRLYYV